MQEEKVKEKIVFITLFEGGEESQLRSQHHWIIKFSDIKQINFCDERVTFTLPGEDEPLECNISDEKERLNIKRTPLYRQMEDFILDGNFDVLRLVVRAY